MPKKPGTFGPLVIGEVEFARQQKIIKTKAHRFGPLVLDNGAEEPAVEPGIETLLEASGLDPEKLREAIASVPGIAKDVAEKLVAGAKYVPPVTAPDAPPEEKEPEIADEDLTPPVVAQEASKAPDANGDGYSSIGELLKALNANEVSVEGAIALELVREGGARKGGIQAINAKEAQRTGGPRPEIVEQLNAALAKL